MSGRQSPTKATARSGKPAGTASTSVTSSLTDPPTTPATPDPPGTPSGSGTPKAIGNLAKKGDGVTRGGATKWKFAPTLPTSRPKPVEVKREAVASPIPASPGGRGRGTPRGRGRGRGDAPRPAVEMVASGPFAMGPAMSGSGARRAAPRSNFAPVAPMGAGTSTLGAGLSRTAAPTLQRDGAGGEVVKAKVEEEDVEVYSDPDEGVEIVDMDDIRNMDWMAPESLRRDKLEGKKRKNKLANIKKEEEEVGLLKGKGKERAMDVDEEETAEEKQVVNLANALDLSESEEEEELETLMEDFANLAADENPDIRQERMYFFQFPSPFPTFVMPEPLFLPENSADPPDDAMDTDYLAPAPDADASGASGSADIKGKRRVSFAADVKPPAPTPPGVETPGPDDKSDATTPKIQPRSDGLIGQLEIYKSGDVKMRLGNGILMDVTAATQPSFLQHAVYLNPEAKKLCVLGEVNKRFVVSPDVDALLESVEVLKKNAAANLEGQGLIKMDDT